MAEALKTSFVETLAATKAVNHTLEAERADDLAKLERVLTRAREAQATHVRAVEDSARQETRERQTALTAAKAHAARVRELEAELTASRTATAEPARALAVEHARREALERQLADMDARLADAIASPPDRSRPEGTVPSQDLIPHAGCAT